MQGTILEKILKTHTNSEAIHPGEVIPIKVDHIMFPDNSALPILEFLKKENLTPKHKSIFLSLNHFYYQFQNLYSHYQQQIEKYAKEYKFKVLENYHGLWHYSILKKNTLKPGSIFLGRDSTINFFSPLNNLNISSGIQDIIQAMLLGNVEYIIPEVVNVNLTGEIPKNISGKDIALFLKQNLTPKLTDGHYNVEFSGSFLDHAPFHFLHTIAHHHYAMNASGFTFPPCGKVKKREGIIFPDEEVKYCKEIRLDISKLEPLLETNNTITEVEEFQGRELDKIFIGNSIGGTLPDMELLSKKLKDKKVKTQCLVTPASSDVLQQASEKGYLNPILKAGCILLTPATGISAATNGIVPLEGDRILTTAINQISITIKERPLEFYAASIQTAIDSALEGKIVSPKEIKNVG